MIDPNPPVNIEWPPANQPRSRRKPPRDFRWFVGGLARVMISIGVLIFALVGYQLWGTRLQEASSQDRLAGKFEKLLGHSPKATVATAAPSSAASPPTTRSAPSSSPLSSPALTAATSATTELPSTSTAPVAPSAPATLAPITDGDPVANLVIPKIGLDKIVVSGVSTSDLRKGPGHFPETVLPGERGNAAIAAHRTTYGAPFYRLDELEPGDSINVTTVAGHFVYKVVDTKIVAPTDFAVLAPTDDAELTLISCHPRLSAAKRIVVRAVLDTSASAVPTEPSSPATVASTTQPSPSTTATSLSLGGVGTEGERAAVQSPSGSSLPAVGGDAGTEGATGAGPNSAAAVALRQGWFADSIAWADVAVWGAVLTGIALLAWRLSVRCNNNWIGASVGFVPFVVALYFFFENLSRLLPPNL